MFQTYMISVIKNLSSPMISMVWSSSTDRWDVVAKAYLLESITGLWATG